VLLFSIAIGILPISKGEISYRSSLAWNSIIGSESYLVSMIFFIMALSLVVLPIMKEGSPSKKLNDLIFSLFLLLLMGFSKISTLFIFDVVILFIYIRIKAYHFLRWNIFLFSAACISLVVFYFLYDPRAPSGSVEFLSFYKNFIRTNFPAFIVLTNIWSLVLLGICVFLSVKKMRINTILLELQIVIVLAGVIPGTFLKIAGGSAYYFSDIQHWTALFFIAYYYTFCIKFIDNRYWKLIGIAGVLFMILSINNGIYGFEKVLKDNFSTKSCILGGKIYYTDYVKMHEIEQNTSIFFDENLKNRLAENEDFSRLIFLTSLDNMEHKGSRILHLEDEAILSKYLPCYKAPFFITAATGMSLFNGFSLKRCYYEDYGVEYYTRDDTVSNSENICEHLRNPVFKEVVYCNIAAQSYKIISCKK
jgi:hypothetical protein